MGKADCPISQEMGRHRPLDDGRVVSATLAPTADSCGVVWYLDEDLQDAAQSLDRESALAWANDVREMLLATFISRISAVARSSGGRSGGSRRPSRV